MPLSESDRRRLAEDLERERRVADNNTEPAKAVRNALEKFLDRSWIACTDYDKCKFYADKAAEALKIGDAAAFASNFCDFAKAFGDEVTRVDDSYDEFREKVSEAREDIDKFISFADALVDGTEKKHGVNVGEYWDLSNKAKAATRRLTK